jgi:hypothetical protein
MNRPSHFGRSGVSAKRRRFGAEESGALPRRRYGRPENCGFVLLFALVFLARGYAVHAAGPPIVTPPSLLNDRAAGQALAADLCNAKPSAPAEFKGVLKIRRPDRPTISLPLVSRILTEGASWQAFYQVTASNWTETLLVRHQPGQDNEYRYARQESGSSAAAIPPVCGQIWQSFAGSDFSLADLGLEFFHWPTQVLVLNEMRKDRACHLLESRPALTNDYGRVLSWVDVETGGLLKAEAYDGRNQRLKEFEVKRFKKSGEQWQLQEMEIRNLKNRSRTLLEFDVADK